MKQDFAFVATRALARHDPALIRPGPADADLIEALNQAAARLARSLRGGLARLCGGEPPNVTVAAPHEVTLADFPSEHVCLYSTYQAMPAGVRLLSAIDGEAIMRLVDRAFGGPGEAPRLVPRELPLSADLMVQRIEAILATHLGQALAPKTGHSVIHADRRDTDLKQLQPFAPSTRLAVLDIAVCEGTRAPWPIRMAMPMSALAVLTGIAALPQASGPDRALADPASEPFCAMPLKLTALLVDTRLPLQTVSRLEPGTVLNLPIARQVPLVVGQHGVGRSAARTVAVGSIGEVDDRVAIQITRLA